LSRTLYEVVSGSGLTLRNYLDMVNAIEEALDAVFKDYGTH
jgi:hypothetical protein